MIQRIQTLYLLLAAGLVACAAFLPLASFASGGEEFRLYAFGLRTADGETVQSTLYMGILLAVALVLPLTTIFLFIFSATASSLRSNSTPRASNCHWCCRSSP